MFLFFIYVIVVKYLENLAVMFIYEPCFHEEHALEQFHGAGVSAGRREQCAAALPAF